MTKEQGFTLLEIIAIVAVIALLSGLIAPIAKNLINEGKAQRIVELAGMVKEACHRHFLDTDKHAVEDTGPLATPNTADQYFHLSRDNGDEGWRGPYLRHSLAFNDHPYGEQILVGNTLEISGNKLFDLYGQASFSSTGNGNYIAFWQVPEAVARFVDEKLDNNLGGDTNWFAYGKVRWSETLAPPVTPNAATEKIVIIYLGKFE